MKFKMDVVAKGKKGRREEGKKGRSRSRNNQILVPSLSLCFSWSSPGFASLVTLTHALHLKSTFSLLLQQVFERTLTPYLTQTFKKTLEDCAYERSIFNSTFGWGF